MKVKAIPSGNIDCLKLLKVMIIETESSLATEIRTIPFMLETKHRGIYNILLFIQNINDKNKKLVPSRYIAKSFCYRQRNKKCLIIKNFIITCRIEANSHWLHLFSPWKFQIN